VKKLFLVLLVLMVGISGLSAMPLRPGGGNDTPLTYIPQEDMIAFTAPRISAPMRPAMTLVIAQNHEAAFTQATGMRFLAEKTKKNVDRLFMSWEVEMGIRRPISLAPAKYPLLC
jgi:hypothetical protein